ncbi:MAG TPA: Ig-like domain-containing protein [Chthoniobacteraceae bacterium]|jgi:hypothetical protein|nr:Ig-like domain-containing protein [Chthoniobacteraceae bacterium]
MTPRFLSLARAALVFAALAGSAAAQQPAFFAFFSNIIVDNAPPTGFATAPVLDDTAASAANVTTVLGSAPPPPAVQVRMELASPEALAVLGNFGIKYIFTEFNTLGADRRTKAVADAALTSGTSAGAFVGNFNLYPNLQIDPTRPAAQSANFAGIDYAAARGHVGAQLGLQFAAPALLPGSVDFRNPAQGDSSAPNIRSALFVLPIQRLTLAELGLRGFTAPPADETAYAIAASPNDPAQRLLPWVMRFNNLDNPALGGGPSGPGFVQNAATPSNGQLPSRGDFQAQILHYRLRGADDLIVLSGSNTSGVVGYSDPHEQSDVQTGWIASTLATGIIARQNYAFANLSNTIADSVDTNNVPVLRDSEPAGAVWSGVYDRAGSVDTDGQRKLAVLISNLSSVQKTIDLPSIGGFGVEHPIAADPRPAAFILNGGTHRLLSFTLAPDANNVTAWILTDDAFIGLDNDRNGVGTTIAFPALHIDVVADSDVCAGSSGNVATVTSPGANTVYHWAVEGGTIQSGQDTPTITYSVAGAGTAVVALTAISTDAQQVETAYEGAAIVRSGPPSDITVPPVVFASSQGNFASGPAGNGLSYSWSISGNGVLTSTKFAQVVQFRAGASGTLTLTLTVTGGGCTSTSTATVSIDRTPVVTNDRALATAGHSVDIQVLANDQDPDPGDPLTLSIESQPAFGTVMLINNGTAIRYTPTGAVKNDSFTYRVTDSHGASAVGTVTIEDFATATIGDFRGLAMPAAGTASENARHGLVHVTVARNGAFSGYLTLAGVRRAFSGTFDFNGASHFKPALTPTFAFQRRAGETPLALALQLAPAGDPDQISGTLTDNGAPFAALEIARIVSAGNPSLYTYSYAALAAPNRGVPLSEFPQGYGYSFGLVNNRGSTIVRGRLADLGSVVVADALTKGNRLPFYMPLYGGLGSISGWINFRNMPGASDADALELDWFRPPQPTAAIYKKGWPGGIGVRFRGSKFEDQGALSALPGLGPVDQDGNAELMLRSGGLPDAGVFDALNISPANRVTKAGINPRRLRNLVLSKIGGFNGYFRVPGETVDRLMYGVVIQKTNFLAGFFIGQDGSGLVTITPEDMPRQSP